MKFTYKKKFVLIASLGLVILFAIALTGKGLVAHAVETPPITPPSTTPATPSPTTPAAGQPGTQPTPPAQPPANTISNTPTSEGPTTGADSGIGSLLGGLFSLSGITGKVIAFVTYVGVYIFSTLASVAFKFAGFLIGMALTLNKTLLDNSSNNIVSAGWPIILNFANLGFVLAIIIIAFATILRVEKYAMKQVLWKLIVAALLVNFSLVIAGAFLDVSDNFTNFFLDKVTIDGPNGLPTVLAQTLAIQSLVASKQQAGGGFGTFNQLIQIIPSIAFVLLFTIIGAITLLAVAVMLLIRYIYLAILLILSPIVWLFWIFPSTQKHWQKWWEEFMRWTFFTPIMLFFLYLAIFTMANQTNNTYKNLITTAATSINGIGTTNGPSLDNSLLSSMGNMAVVLGLMMGGLFAANSMGITGGKAFYGMAQKAGKGVGVWAGRKGIRAGTYGFRKSQKAIDAMQTYGAGKGAVKRFFTGAPIVNRLGQGLSNIGVRQGEKLVKEAEERQKGLSDKQLSLRVPTMSPDELVAAFSRLAKNKNLDMVPKFVDYMKKVKTENTFMNYGKKKEYGDVEKTFASNRAILNAENEEQARDEAVKFFSGWSKTDWGKAQFNDAYTEKPSFGQDETAHKLRGETIAWGVGKNNPGDTTKILTNVKAQNFERATEALLKMGNEMQILGDRTRGEKIVNNTNEAIKKRMSGTLYDYTIPPPTTPSTP